MKRVALVIALTLAATAAACSRVERSATEEATPATEAVQPPASEDAAQALQDIEERQGPFLVSGQEFTAVLRYKRAPRDGGLGSQALVSLAIRDAAGAVSYEESFSYDVEQGAFTSLCLATVSLLRGSSGTGLLVDSGCLPSAPLAGGPWRVLGVVGGRLVPFGKPLVTQGELGEFVPGPINRTGDLTVIRTDALTVRTWTGYYFVSVPVRIDWRDGTLVLGQRCMYQTGRGLAEEGCDVPVEGAQLHPREQELTFVRMFRESNERSGPPAHVVVKANSAVEVIAGKVAMLWYEGPDAVTISVAEDVWVKVRIDGREGWIHTPEDLNAIGLFVSG